jgi:hypothetical protein
MTVSPWARRGRWLTIQELMASGRGAGSARAGPAAPAPAPLESSRAQPRSGGGCCGSRPAAAPRDKPKFEKTTDYALRGAAGALAKLQRELARQSGGQLCPRPPGAVKRP